ERRIQGNVPRQLGRCAYLGGNDIAISGNEENVIEGEGFRNRGIDHVFIGPGDQQSVDRASKPTGLNSIVESPTNQSKCAAFCRRQNGWMLPVSRPCEPTAFEFPKQSMYHDI